jgi:Protein of unknown function (DUF3311)
VPDSPAPPPPAPTAPPASAPDHDAPAFRWRPYHWLTAVPSLILLAGIPFVNRVHPMILGLPLLMAWILFWVVATSGVMGIILYLDRTHANDGARR